MLWNSSKCSHTTYMLRFFIVSRLRSRDFAKLNLLLIPNLIFEIDSKLEDIIKLLSKKTISYDLLYEVNK
jgi:hypothetical protein